MPETITLKPAIIIHRTDHDILVAQTWPRVYEEAEWIPLVGLADKGEFGSRKYDVSMAQLPAPTGGWPGGVARWRIAMPRKLYEAIGCKLEVEG